MFIYTSRMSHLGIFGNSIWNVISTFQPCEICEYTISYNCIYRLPYNDTKIPEHSKAREIFKKLNFVTFTQKKITLYQCCCETPIMHKTQIPKKISRQCADMGLIDYKWYFYNNGHSCLPTQNSRATPIFWHNFH